MAGIYNSIFVLTPTCMDNVYVLSIWNTPSWAECKSETYVMPCGSHNHWVGKIAPVLVALWVSHDRSWVSLSVFIFVMWERSPGWHHLVSLSSGQAIPFKLNSSITFRVLSWFPRPLVVEQDKNIDQSLTAHFTVGNNVNAACADLTYLKNGWRSSQQLLHRWEMLPWPRPFQVVFVFSALPLRGPATELRSVRQGWQMTRNTNAFLSEL